MRIAVILLACLACSNGTPTNGTVNGNGEGCDITFALTDSLDNPITTEEYPSGVIFWLDASAPNAETLGLNVWSPEYDDTLATFSRTWRRPSFHFKLIAYGSMVGEFEPYAFGGDCANQLDPVFLRFVDAGYPQPIGYSLQ
jgi:hypothetical protein